VFGRAKGLWLSKAIAIGDGALGFWKTLAQVWPHTRCQRCWCHKTANILNYLPKGEQPRAKDALHQVWMAATQGDALRAFDLFVRTYEARYPKATACLVKDKDELLAFYDFPAEHWKHLRTTNPIESTFATVRLRTRRTKGSGSRVACLAMVFKLAQAAELKWRRLNGHKLLGDIIRGVQFKDGTKVAA
jgi:transposase-like protein